MISVVVCSIDPRKFAAVSDNYRQLLEGWPHEIIGIHDAKSLCEGYNRGAARTRGDIIVFSHDDIEILSPDFAAVLATSLSKHAMIGVAGATAFPPKAQWLGAGWPYIHGQVAHRPPGWSQYWVDVYGVGAAMSAGVQVVDGVFFAVRREVLERVRFDEAIFDGFHLYDMDFSYRVYKAGFSIAVSNEIAIVHYSGGNFGAVWSRYATRFLEKHGADTLPSTVTPTYWSGGGALLDTPEQVRAFLRATVSTGEAGLRESQQRSRAKAQTP
jgi:hypothetical protein